MLRVLTFGASVAAGGVPIVSGGKNIDGIGVSGAVSQRDAQVAQAGADAIIRARVPLSHRPRLRDRGNLINAESVEIQIDDK